MQTVYSFQGQFFVVTPSLYDMMQNCFTPCFLGQKLLAKCPKCNNIPYCRFLTAATHGDGEAILHHAIQNKDTICTQNLGSFCQLGANNKYRADSNTNTGLAMTLHIFYLILIALSPVEYQAKLDISIRVALV